MDNLLTEINAVSMPEKKPISNKAAAMAIIGVQSI
jgi:hypothetical protein